MIFPKHFSKMKVSIIIILLLSTFLIHSNGYITIEIEPDDLHRISEILQTHIHQQHHQSLTRSPLRRAIVPLLKTVSSGIVQLFGIMLTLVGANLLTSKLEPVVVMHQTEKLDDINITKPSILLEKCEHEYGCDQNICWRTCIDEKSQEKENNGQSWCFTTANQSEPLLQTCEFAYECSPCWECLGSCNPAE